MPVWDKYIAIEGMVISGIEFPEDYVKIDENMIIKKAKEGSCAVHLRVKTEESEELRLSQNNKLAEQRVLNYASLYTLFSGRSVKVREAGAKTMGKSERLGDFKGGIAKAYVEYPPDLKKQRLEEERRVINAFVEYFKTHERTLIQNRYLMNALNYFYYATRTQRLEDKLINLMVSLESLFTREIQELSYRLSLRVASLIGDAFKGKTPSDVLEDMKDLYKKRSLIVHGEEKIKITYNDVKKLERYTREAIKVFLFLSQNMDQSDILNLLDCSLIDKEKKDKLRQGIRGARKSK